MDFNGQRREKAIYFGSLKKMFVKTKNADFAARERALKKLLGNSVTVARLTLDQLVQVRILVPQYMLLVNVSRMKEEKEYEVFCYYTSG